MPPRRAPGGGSTPTILVGILIALATAWLAVIIVFYSSSESGSEHLHHNHHHHALPRHLHTSSAFHQRDTDHDHRDEHHHDLLHKDSIVAPANATQQRRSILCQSSKGPFRIQVAYEESPKASKFLSYLVDERFWSSGGGIAFFRVNEWITQFGAIEKKYKVRKQPGMNYDKDDEVRDRNPIPDKKKRIPFKRGDMNLLGGTQFTIVRKPNKYMGIENHDTVVGRVPEEDMRNVIDKLYAYNDIIDHPHGGPGPDQTDIYHKGWDYLNKEFPLVDRIISCEWAPNSLVFTLG